MQARDLAAVLAMALPLPCAAQDEATLSRLVELPAHRVLERVRAGATLAPFTTDGCSGGMSRVWTVVADRLPDFAAMHGDTPPWEECCRIHDRAYHTAGPDPEPEASYAARLAADEELRACVVRTGNPRLAEIAALYKVDEETVRQGYDAIAEAMFVAVRLGGGPCSGFPWRWGYGYPNCFSFSLD